MRKKTRTPKFKAGQMIWRGYARRFVGSNRWLPEVRAGFVRKVDDEGFLTVDMLGTMPGAEGKRSPGMWVTTNLHPSQASRTIEGALRSAKSCVRQSLKDEARNLAQETTVGGTPR